MESGFSPGSFERVITSCFAAPQIIDGDSFLLQAIGSGLWPAMVLLSEIVQTFILADFWWAFSTYITCCVHLVERHCH